MLDDYLAAIVIGPSSIPPDEWFFDLLAVPFSSETQAATRRDRWSNFQNFRGISHRRRCVCHQRRQVLRRLARLRADMQREDHAGQGGQATALQHRREVGVDEERVPAGYRQAGLHGGAHP
jgi:hypothetical protein